MKEKLLLVGLFISIILIYPVLAENTDSEIHFTDALGREITLDKPAERIGFANYIIAEAIRLIGAWDKVVARDGYISDSKIYPNLDTIPEISDPSGYSTQLNYEKIIEIKPDVMILLPSATGSISDKDQEIIDTLEPEIPVIFLDVKNAEMFDENVKNLGLLTGESSGAQEYLDFYNEVINGIKEKTSSLSDSEKPDVFIKAAGYTSEEFSTKGKDNALWQQMVEITGGNSISEELEPKLVEVDPEWLLGKDIDIIIGECWDLYYPETFGYSATNPSKKKANADKIIIDISNMDLLSQTNAVKENKIFLLHDPLTHTPRFIVGIAYLAKWLHPELFQDLNPEEIHEKYLDFLGADYDLDAVGYAGYP